MKYDVMGRVADGGWSGTFEAASPQEALSKAIADCDKHPNGRAFEITVRDHVPPMPQTDAYAGMLMSLPPPLLTVTR